MNIIFFTELFNQFKPFAEWEIMDIIYALIASIVIYIAGLWSGLFKKMRLFFKTKKAHKNFRKYLIEECNSLIIVGKRKGLALKDVYVQLDLMKSDLVEKSGEQYHPRIGSFILLGGPGAGKSTTAKNLILKELEINKKSLPFFLRLKEYNGKDTVFHFFAKRLESAGFKNPDEILKRHLTGPNCLCILDGLDEVRPANRRRICDQINEFYSTYFIKSNKRLIVTCRKEAYRDLPINIRRVFEVKPLSDEQIKRFANKWPLEYPKGKSKTTFFNDLSSVSKILELARSPLLLVGGLMHYTEANLGIPEERFEYLQTMAKWLTVDWATAQGHLPDPYRVAYERILTSLSYHMHKKNLSEISHQQAITFIGSLLPTFGYRPEESEKILENILVKTGILTKDGTEVFFSQFGLQEYFTSKELLNKIKAEELVELKPVSWWRESILLYIAQIKDPTKVLTFLFKENPILAVAGVAESPTPSLAVQEKAAQICLEYIDTQNEEIKPSFIAFLRKIKDTIELKFYSDLENRLTKGDKIASIVGTALASAGTHTATSLLAKHPEIWDFCLNDDTGYLSQGFEDLLVSWISDGDDFSSFKAADLISGKMTNDRYYQLLEILPSLSKKKKEHLSAVLLKNRMTNRRRFGINRQIEEICLLVPNIEKYKSFLRDLKKSLEIGSRKSFELDSQFEFISIVFFVCNNFGDCAMEKLHNTVSKGLFWDKNKVAYLSWLASSLCFLSTYISTKAIQLVVLSIIILVYFLIKHLFKNRKYRLKMYYFDYYYLHDRQRKRGFGRLLYFILGGFCFLLIWDFLGIVVLEYGIKYYVTIIALIMFLFGVNYSNFEDWIKIAFLPGEWKIYDFLSKRLFKYLFLLAVSILVILDFYAEIQFDFMLIATIFVLLYFIVLIFFSFNLIKAWRNIRAAAIESYGYRMPKF